MMLSYDALLETWDELTGTQMGQSLIDCGLEFDTTTKEFLANVGKIAERESRGAIALAESANGTKVNAAAVAGMEGFMMGLVLGHMIGSK